MAGPTHIDEQRMLEREALLSAIVEGSEDVILAKDVRSIITFWNSAAERVLGYTADEAIGQPTSILIPEHRAGEDAAVMARIMGGAAVEHYETQRLTKSGELLDVSLTVSAVRDREGNVVGASKIMRDVTDQRRARRTADQLASIVESSDDAILSKDVRGHITSWNRAAQQMFGYTPDEAIGQHISMLFPPELGGRDRDILGEILAGQKVDHYETVRMHKDGQRVFVSLSVSPIRDGSGEIVGASKVVRDITERRRVEAQQRTAEELERANEQLAAADLMKEQFLAMANHELRTPLTSIAGFSRTLLDLGDALSDEQREEFLDIVVAQTDRLTRLVDDMLVLSSARIGGVGRRVRPVEVAPVVREALRRTAIDDIAVTSDPPGIEAVVDPHHLERMVLNYVNNARKYGAAPITVEIARTDDDTEVCIRVCDAGEGVDEEFRPRLFDQFTRAPQHFEQHAPGTGLGLSIVRELTRAQGGDAWFEPREPHGACFCLRLPATGS